MLKRTRQSDFSPFSAENKHNDSNHTKDDEVEMQSICKVIRTFESMPSKKQNILLSQLVDKCSKKQLSFISNIIMPRLKIDILRHVPREISLQIIGHLPVKSLCRLAQTCSYHKDLVNDGHLWRKLLTKYEFDDNKPTSDVKSCPPIDVNNDIIGCPSPPHNRSSSQQPLSVSTSDSEKSFDSAYSTSTTMSSCTSLESDVGDSPRKRHSMTMIESCLIPVDSSSRPSSFIESHSNISHKQKFQMEYVLKNNWMKGRCNHFTIRGPQAAIVTCLQFSNDILAIATDNSTYGLIEIFHSQHGHRLKKLDGHEGGVWALEFIDDVLVSGGCDRDLRVWNLDSGECKFRLRGHTSTIRCLQMADKTTVVTGSRDHTVRVWDIEQGICKKVFEGHSASVRCLAMHGHIVVSGSYDCTLRVWDLKRERLIHVLQQHHAQIYSVAFNGKYICSGSLDADIRVWDVVSGKCLWTLEGHDALVGHMQLRGTTLVTGGSDGRICIWNVVTGELIRRFQAHHNSVTTLQFDEQRILSGGDDGIKVWDFKTGKEIRTLANDVSGVWRLQFDKYKLISATQRQEDSFIEIMDFSPQKSRLGITSDTSTDTDATMAADNDDESDNNDDTSDDFRIAMQI